MSLDALLSSNIGLGLAFVPPLVHGLELLFPMLAGTFIASYVLPPCGFVIPKSENALTSEDLANMVIAAVEAAPWNKATAAKDWFFVMSFESRQGASGFLATAIGALYAYTLPLEQRHPIHLLLLALDVCMFIGNLHHAGVPFLGHNPMVTPNGRYLGIAFAPFWALNFYFNYVAFTGSKNAALKID